MGTLCFEIIGFVIEFIKLYLAVVVLFQIKQHKTVWISFWGALFALAFVFFFWDASQFSFINGAVAIGILSFHACDKKKIGIIVLSFLGISIIDMIFASICIVVFHLDQNMISENGLNIGFNLFSLVVLLFVSFLISRKQGRYQPFQIKRHMVLYFLGGIALSLYLTAVQFMGMGESYLVYGKDLAIGMSLSSLVLVAVCVLLMISSNRNEHLKRETEITARLLESQKAYYTLLLEKERETKAFRHDMKQHLYCMHHLFQEKKYTELGEYLMDMNGSVEELSSGIRTGNDLITAITNDISGKFPDVQLQWIGMIPEELSISSLDICTIFYNLLSNAFEAVPGESKGGVEVAIKFLESTMMVSIRNPYGRKPCLVDGVYVTGKQERGHGYGLMNVKKCVERNGGSYSAACDGGFFLTEVILPHAL